MKRKLLAVTSFILLTLISVNANAQALEDFAAKYTSDNGPGYTQPLADALGANLNSGFFRSAHIPKKGFRLQLGLVTMTALVRDDDKTFQATTDDFFTPQTTTEVPTIFGSTNGVSVDGNGGTVYNFPGGLGVDMLPIAAPQVSVGSLLGTELLIRFFAADIGDDLGRLNLFGWGIRHSIDQYLPETWPVSLAVGYYRQNLALENFSDSETSFISLQASYQKGVVTVYGGPGYEMSSLNISYLYDNGEVTEEVAISPEDMAALRFTLGVRFRSRAILPKY